MSMTFQYSITDEHKQIILDIIRYLNTDYSSDYPYLYKILKRRKRDLQYFLQDSIKFMREYYKLKNSVYWAMDYPQICNALKIKKNDKAIKSITLFCLLGIIRKLSVNELSFGQAVNAWARSEAQGYNKIINYFLIDFNKDILHNANIEAKKLIDNHIYLNNLTREWVLKVFGKQKADEIFPQFKYENSLGISETNSHMEFIIGNVIYKSIKDNGYATYSEIVEILKSSFSEDTVKAHYQKSLNSILENYNLKMIQTNRKIIQEYKVDTKGSIHAFPKIIVQR